MSEGSVASSRDEIGVCPKCGTRLPVSRPPDRCPVCQLRAVLDTEEAPSLTATTDVPELAEDRKAQAAGGRFDHYELLTDGDGRPIELGRGAMGVTYRAFDSNLRCSVALKVINARFLNDEAVRLRFVREARAAAQLRHPNVASVFHLGTKNGDYFYAMEFVEGETLEQLIRRQGPMPAASALDIVDQVAAALEAAHKEQIVHRDIKPGNIMLRFGDDGGVNVKVIDFGLAKASSVHSEAGLSTPGSFTGTAVFASPEQCAGSEVDGRSDIYSLGITLWEALTGKVPFTGSAIQVMSKHLHARLPLEQLKEVPAPIVVLLERMLEKDPDQRQQNPIELRAQLRAAKQALETPGLPAVPVHRSHAGSWVHKRKWLGAGGFILLVAVAVGWFLWGVKSQPGSANLRSIAVLPFDNLSDNKENAYFSDGLTSEVIFQLSSVSDLRVIARSSILHYKNVADAQRKPLKEVGAELGVGAILESSVQRAGDHVRVVTILYDAVSGQRLWGATYDRELKDMFAIQSDLAEQIATALNARLSADERAALRREPTANLATYDLYLRGRALWELHLKDSNDKAIDLFKQALGQDPKFVLAYIGLADAYIDKVKRFHEDDSWLSSAIDLCQQAIAIDPRQLRAYTQLASAFNLKGWFDRMDAPIRKALELAPNDWDANRMAAAESTEFRREPEMYESIRKCFVSNPLDSWAPYELALICWTVDEKDLAEKWMQRAIDLEPNAQRRQLMQNERLVYRGEYAAALPGLQQLPSDLKTHYTTAGELALFCSMQVGDWAAVTRIVEARADKDSPTNLMRLTLALRGTSRTEEARQMAERVVSSAQSKLATGKSPRWLRFDLAVGNRVLQQTEAAYQYLRGLIDSDGFPDPVLGRVDPGLEVFKSDTEFQSLLDRISKQNAETRSRILQIEHSF
jgi:serine/threonine protein kinase/tetratricopeptide (TPR) repeat protein